MKKKWAGIALLLFIALALPLRQGYCEEQTPEQLVRDFYVWYFKMDEGAKRPEKSDEIYKYVAEKAVKYIRHLPPGGVSYFAKANTYGSVGWVHPKIVVGESVPMAGDMYIVPVTFELRYEDYHEDYHVVVFVMKEKGIFHIIKVTDIYPYSQLD